MASVVKIERGGEASLSPTIGQLRRLSSVPPQRGSLAAVIEREVIPRLMLAHGTRSGPAARAAGHAAVELSEIEAFAPLTLRVEAATLLAQVERIMARGVGVDAIFVDLLAPTAHRLGEWWEDDRCDFLEVTMGLWRLQEVVRELSARVPPRAGGRDRAPLTALFAAVPGDQHDFGAIIVGEVFRGEGWDTDIAVGADMSDLLGKVGGQWFDVIGLTVSCDCHSERLPSVILALRSVSRNPRVRVMVGGRVFVEDPGLAVRVGADGTAADARVALVVAGNLVDAVDAMAC